MISRGYVLRSAFLYMDPTGDPKRFAQCGTCKSWMLIHEKCALFVDENKVREGDTCGLYVPGTPTDRQSYHPSVWAADAGFERRQVRCENCKFYKDVEQVCGLFEMLNARMSETFDLNTKVHPQGCCNANTPR